MASPPTRRAELRGLERRLWLRKALAILCSLGTVTVRLDAQERRRPTFVVLIDGSREYHTPGCSLVAGNASAKLLPMGDAEAKGITAHAECHRTAGERPRGGAGSSSTTATYWLDVKTRRYHRPGCSLIGLPRVRTTLARALESKYLPCRSCKPETELPGGSSAPKSQVAPPRGAKAPAAKAPA